jgi:putative two-component system response regulator
VPDTLTDMRVLVVDDNAANIDLLEQILQQAGYTNVLSTQDPEGVEHLCEAWEPDLVLLDLHMPKLTGYQVMAKIRRYMQDPNSLPVLVITADGSVDACHRALSLGARDFVTKPIDQTELLLRVHNVLHTRALQRELQLRNDALDEAVRERTAELEQARLESLTILAAVGESHDDDTAAHTRRVGLSAAAVAAALRLPRSFVEAARDAAPLHDIGKIAISRQILLKPGPLTDAERTVMQCHARYGAEILASAHSPVLKLAAEIARTHHECWDGTGYPDGLAGEQIPLGGRITAVADVFDALTHQRPYKDAWTVDDALEYITHEAGHQFDPSVVTAFLSLGDALLRELAAAGPADARLLDPEPVEHALVSPPVATDSH